MNTSADLDDYVLELIEDLAMALKYGLRGRDIFERARQLLIDEGFWDDDT